MSIGRTFKAEVAVTSLLEIAVLALVIGLSGCSILQKLGGRPKEELSSEQKQKPERSGGGNFFFEIDREWRKRHPECTRKYGVVHYQDHNGNGKYDPSGEIIRVIPPNYPVSEIDFSKRYEPDGKTLREQREKERERKKDQAIKHLLESIPKPSQPKADDSEDDSE